MGHRQKLTQVVQEFPAQWVLRSCVDDKLDFAVVAEEMKDLYQQVVVQDGYQPALDSSGRPKFFFLQKNVKACFTENGMKGVCKYGMN